MTSDQFWRVVITAAVFASIPAIKSAVRTVGERRRKSRAENGTVR